MRKVLFKRFIPKGWQNDGNGNMQAIEGTNRWEDDFTHAGYFHAWGVTYEEFETGPGNFTVGIIELEDGTVEEVLPINIKFIS